MHPQGEEGATVPQCPHLLTNDARWLTLLRTRRTGTNPSLRVRSRQKHLLLLGPTTRWVAIHRSVQIHHKCFFFCPSLNTHVYSRLLMLTVASQNHSSATLTATELREKLLREKVKALRKSSSTQKSPTAEESPNYIIDKD